MLQEAANRNCSRPETGQGGGKGEDHRSESMAWRRVVKVLELHSVLGWRNPFLHMVSAGLSNTSTWTCPEFKHKVKFPYKKVHVLQKMAQFCQLHLPHQYSAHQFLCSVSPIINSSAWQIWPSARLSLVGAGAGYCSFKADNLDTAVGCMWMGQ